MLAGAEGVLRMLDFREEFPRSPIPLPKELAGLLVGREVEVEGESAPGSKRVDLHFFICSDPKAR